MCFFVLKLLLFLPDKKAWRVRTELARYPLESFYGRRQTFATTRTFDILIARKYRPNGTYGLFQVWETLLQEVEVDSAVVADIANCLNRQVSRPMVDNTFHRKLEARKIFQHREQLENALEKASQQLDKVMTSTSKLFTFIPFFSFVAQDENGAQFIIDGYNSIVPAGKLNLSKCSFSVSRILLKPK